MTSVRRGLRRTPGASGGMGPAGRWRVRAGHPRVITHGWLDMVEKAVLKVHDAMLPRGSDNADSLSTAGLARVTAWRS